MISARPFSRRGCPVFVRSPGLPLATMGGLCDKPPVATNVVPEAPVEREESEEDDDDELPEPPPMQKKGARSSVSAEAYGDWNKQAAFTLTVIEKSDDQKRRIRAAMDKSWMFQSLEEKNKAQVVDALKEEKYSAGQDVIVQFDVDADRLFVIEQGVLSAYKKKAEGEDGRGMKVFTYENAGVFGELALLYNCPRAATVTADTDSTLWSIDRDTFNNLVKESAKKARAQTEEFLKTVPILKSLTVAEVSSIGDAVQKKAFRNGDTVIREGDVGNEFFIVTEGTAKAIKGGKAVMDYGPKDYFGELALIEEGSRHADVKATSDLVVLSLDRLAFKRLLGPLDAILKERAHDTYKDLLRSS